MFCLYRDHSAQNFPPTIHSVIYQHLLIMFASPALRMFSRSSSMPEPAKILTSPILTAHAITHAFTTRRGGVSAGIFESLSFGNPGDLPAERRDPAANIAENFRRALLAIGITQAWISEGNAQPDVSTPHHAGNREIVQIHQVHGSAVHVVEANGPSHATDHDTRADALVTDDPSRVIAIRIADCTPILVATKDGRVVAAIHAGWRGVVAGIVPATIAAMHRVFPTSSSKGLVAAIGPCISVDHFEVGHEVAAEFAAVFGPSTSHIHPGDGNARPHIDLKSAIIEQLVLSGLHHRGIDTLPHCTVAEPDLFFSHRRDHGLTGRMVAMISPTQ